MSTRVLRGPSARGGLRRRKNELDLNSAPPGENRNQEGTSTQVLPQVEQPSQPPLVIDLEAIDDDVVISSPRAIAEAENNSRRNRRRPIVDLESHRIRATRHKRRRVEPKQTIINCELYINLDGNSNSNSRNEHATQPPLAPPPPPPKEPTFTCPICMAPLVEEMSTKCGHIFCKKCIKAAITAQGKCPTCRRKVTVKELIRVFLPTSSLCIVLSGDRGPEELLCQVCGIDISYFGMNCRKHVQFVRPSDNSGVWYGSAL